jgi:hypothetical protein
MKNISTLLVSVLLLAACSSPRYTYYFDHYDYNSGKKKATAEKALLADNAVQPSAAGAVNPPSSSPLILGAEPLSVSAANNTIAVNPAKTVAPAAAEKKYSAMSKTEKKEFRKTLKTAVKKYMKAKKAGDEGASVSATKALDYNLKMAIIFGAVALTLSFFGGTNSVFWVASVVCLVIGVVFFIKWIAEQ